MQNPQPEAAARGIRAVEEAAAVDPTKRVKKYIAYEPLLIAATSPEVTLIHAGRSSQDILSTMRMALDWEEAAQIAGALDDVIAKILDLAEQHRDTIVPNYTNGVAAQPNSYAHYLLGFAASFLRDRERLAQCLVRYDMSSMGATVLNGTGWPLNRAAMKSGTRSTPPARRRSTRSSKSRPSPGASQSTSAAW